ncbi:MAG TPA: hypothetical protein VGL76_07375 [Gaiellaceae bacterium]
MVRPALFASSAASLALFAGACGTSSRPVAKKPAAGAATAERRLRSRLVAAGYQADGEVGNVALEPVPSAAFALRDVDFTSPHTFSVAIYSFHSHRLASRFDAVAKRRLAADLLVEHSPKARAEYGLSVAGSHVYFAFTSMDPTLCVPFGLCASFQVYGPELSCDGSGTCVGSGPAPLPQRDFARVVASGR